MDLPSHALWAFALFHHQPSALAYAVFSVFPDLLWGVPAVTGFILSGQGISRLRQERWRRPEGRNAWMQHPLFGFVRRAYNVSHSWLLMAFASALVAWLLPALAAPFFAGVFLHLALDLFVHKDSVGAQMPFFPASKWRVKGFLHWSNKKFLIANYALLAAVYALIFLGYF